MRPAASAPAKHHPLLVYAIVDAAKNAQFLALKKRGFKRYSTGSSTYWRREADEPVDGATPLIFAHGIGIGFLPYHNLINDLVDGCDDGRGADVPVGIARARLDAFWERTPVTQGAGRGGI